MRGGPESIVITAGMPAPNNLFAGARKSRARAVNSCDALRQHLKGMTMLRYVAALLIGIMSSVAGEAAELKIFAALVLQDALGRIAPQFARDSGHAANVTYSTVGAIRQRLAAGERADIVVLTSEAIEALDHAGTLVSSTPVAATRTGVAIRDGAVAP